MDLFEQLNKIDEYIEELKLRDAQDISLASGSNSGFGMGFSSWQKPDSVLKPSMDGGAVWADPDSVLKPSMDGGAVWADPDSVLKPNFTDVIGTVLYDPSDFSINFLKKDEKNKKKPGFSSFFAWLDQYI